MSTGDGVVGVADSNGGAVFVTATGDGTLLDRRRVELVDDGLPKFPYHHEAQRLPLDEAVALVGRVRASAERRAEQALAALAADLPGVKAIALRACPPLPQTVAARLESYQACNVADWVVYRQALASAATARGWSVHWFTAKTVLDDARAALAGQDLDARFLAVQKAIGPPWRNEHRMAMAAAIVAANARQG